MKKLIKLVLCIFVALVFVPAGPAHAADEQPTEASLTDIEIFTDLLVTGDFLAVVPYDITFPTDPDVGIDDTYIFRVLDPTGTTELGTNTAVTTYNNGYGLGVVSFYIETGMAANTSYVFRIQQNPGYYPTPDYWDTTINPANYSTEDDQAAAIKAKIIDTAISLTPEFSVSLLTTTESGSTVLSTYGEMYYLAAIPGLQSMCPDIFGVQLQNPDFSKRSWSTAFVDLIRTKFAGTFVEDFMTGFAGMFSVETNTAMNALSIVIFGLFILLSIWKFKATILSAMIDGYCLLLDLMLMGFFSMIWAGFLAFIAIALGGVIAFFKRS